MSTWNYIPRSRSFINLGPNHSDSVFANFVSSVTSWPVEVKFHVALAWDVGMEVTPNGLGHMTKIAPCPYMVKMFKNLLLNQKADDLETWYESFGTQVLPNLSKWWPWVDLDIFYSKVKFGPFCICLGKRLNCRLPRNWCILWGESRYI